MNRYIWLIALVLLYGCEQPLGPEYYPQEKYEKEPNAFSVISPHYSTQKVFVGMSYKVTESVASEEWVGVSGAQVIVSTDEQEVTFNELLSPGVYASESLVVKYQEVYSLKVVYPDNKKVTGTTRVPSEFHILSPANGDSVSAEDTLAWEKSGGAVSYIVKCTMLYDTIPTIGDWEEIGDITSISLSRLFSIIFGRPPVTGKRLRLEIAAIDRNYRDYLRIPWYGTEGLVHLNGGLGVFGSLVISDSIVVIIKSP